MTWPPDPDASMVLTARTAHLRGFRPMPPAALLDRPARPAEVVPASDGRRWERLWLLSISGGCK